MKPLQVLLILAVAAVSTFVVALIYSTSGVVAEETQPIFVKVVQGRTIGFNLETERVNFGKLRPGDTGERTIIINNNRSQQHRIKIGVSGEVDGWIFPSQSNFIMEPHTEQEVYLRMRVPSVEPGNYTGTLHVYFTKP